MELGFSVIAKGYWDHMPQQSTKEIFNLVLFAPKVATIAPSSRVQIRVGPNSEYGTNTEYRIIRFLKILRIPNTELFGFRIWMNTEYRIALFGLNYSNTEYLKSNSSPPKNLICEFCDQMRWGKFDPLFSYLHERFLLCFLHISFL